MNLLYQKLYPIRINDLNYGQHVGHQKVYEFCHDVRLEWLRTKKASEQDFGGCSLVVSFSQAHYKAEILYPSELLIRLYWKESQATRFTLSYTLEDSQTHQMKALVETTLVCLSPQTRRPTRIPSDLLRG